MPLIVRGPVILQYVYINDISACSKVLMDPGIDRVGKLGSDGNPLVRSHSMSQY